MNICIHASIREWGLHCSLSKNRTDIYLLLRRGCSGSRQNERYQPDSNAPSSNQAPLGSITLNTDQFHENSKHHFRTTRGAVAPNLNRRSDDKDVVRQLTTSRRIHNMSLTINTNYSAVRAGFNLARNSNSLQDSINRLSSGQRINRPSDDSGGLAVSMKLRSSINRLNGANNNIQNGVSFLEVQDGVWRPPVGSSTE